MFFWCFALLLSAGPALAVADATLLRQVANTWLGERHRWAFTQIVREYEGKDGKELKQERLERFDPSQRLGSRWRLISIDGRPPTPDEWAEWSKRKNKKPRHDAASIVDNFDFAAAHVTEETPDFVRYDLPLRSNAEWLFPINKVGLNVTISKAGPALEEVRVRINEPFRVALGLARVLDLEFNLQLQPPTEPLAVDPADARPSGTARAVVAKPGGRVEYSWSNFQRVTPHADLAVEPARVKTP